jgi:mRNA interferase RelE/StbE
VARYAVEIKQSTRKELERLSDSLLARISERIEGLSTNPRPPGCKKLRGYKDLWRIRVGNYRIVYILDDLHKIVSITRIAHRGDIYKR